MTVDGRLRSNPNGVNVPSLVAVVALRSPIGVCRDSSAIWPASGSVRNGRAKLR